MAYARFFDGDVYVFHHIDDYFCCMACRLTPKDVKTIVGSLMHSNFTCGTEKEMLNHLEEHIEAGHKVPDHAIKRLREEIG